MSLVTSSPTNETQIMKKTKLSKKEKQDARVLALAKPQSKSVVSLHREPGLADGHQTARGDARLASSTIHDSTNVTARSAWLHDDPTGERLRIHNLHIEKFQSGVGALVAGDASMDADIDRILTLWAKG